MSRKQKRYTISVTRRIYDLLRERSAAPSAFVDGIVASALDDPQIAATVVERIQSRAACGRIASYRADPDCF